MAVPFGLKLLGAGALVGAAIWHAWPYLDVARAQAKLKVYGPKTMADRLAQFGPAVDARLAPHFERAGVPYPPATVVLAGYKRERVLDVFAAGEDGNLAWVRRYPILAASGGPGPKLRQGDYQVPEGLYRIELLNPNSKFHLSLRVNYPNAADRRRAEAEGRTKLGGDIMIHGKALSAGCLAMGDPAAEDLFILAARTGHENLEVILAPSDIARATADPAQLQRVTPWYPERWTAIQQRLRALPPAPPMLTGPRAAATP
ncbi:MAG: L,D-transpeptidase family protein [Verrucomicrobiota bacterium]